MNSDPLQQNAPTLAGRSVKGRNQLSLAFGRLRRKKLGMVTLTVISIIYLAGIFAPALETHGYTETNLRKTQEGPDTENFLGTDRLGRDTYSRLLWGIQTTVIVTVATLATGALLLGLTLGLIAGYFRGAVDSVIARLGEVVSAFPDILLIILLAATVRPRVLNWTRSFEDSTGISGLVSSGFVDFVVIGIALLPLSWFGTMRLVRGQVLQLRDADYIEAARAMGTSTPRILFRHILPNIISPLIVTVSFGMGAVAGTEIALSFFGLGVQPPRPSLGIMIAEATGRGGTATSVLTQHPEQLLAPIAVVWLLIFSWNILGDALTDVFNPRSR
jgi:ABC-type dipeptide/oligopeptide/nickel transport system permease subunit